MLVIRLSRVGKKKQPTYRVVVQEKQRDPWGTSVEIIGNYNPRTEPSTLNLKEDRVKHWLERGAQPSPTVHNLLVDIGLVKGPKVRATCHDKAEPTPVTDSPAPAPAVETEKVTPVEEAPAPETPVEAEPVQETPIPETPAEESPTLTGEEKPAAE